MCNICKTFKKLYFGYGSTEKIRLITLKSNAKTNTKQFGRLYLRESNNVINTNYLNRKCYVTL